MSKVRGSLKKYEIHNKQQLAIDPQHSHLRAHFGMTIIALLIITNLTGLALAENKKISYNLIPLDKNPGIYYEQLPNIRTFNEKLKLRIYRNVTNFETQLDELRKFEEKYPESCPNGRSRCWLDIDPIKEAYNKQIQYFQSQKARNGERYINEPQDDKRFDYYFKCRWNAPDNLIDVTGLILDKPGIIESEVSFLKHRISYILNSEDDVHTTEIDDFLKNDTRKQEAVEGYEMELKNLVEAIDYARNGTFHRRFIPLENISSCIEQIQPRNQQLQRFLDQSKDAYTEKKMIRLSKVDVAYINSTFIYTISIPLLHNDTFSLYRLHPVPIKQDGDNSDNKFAFIRPSSEYIAISNRNFSFEFSESFFTHCELFQGTFVCTRDQPLLYQDEAKKKSCELALYLGERLDELLHLCDVMVISFDGIYLSELRTPNFWIFASSASENLTIVCPGSNEKRRVPLIGTGVLQLMNRYCTADNSGPATPIDSDSISLETMRRNITKCRLKLSEIIKIEGVELSSDSYPYLNASLNANRLKSNGRLLNEIIRQEIEFNRRISPIVVQLSLITYFIGAVILFGLLLLFYIIFQNLRECRPAGGRDSPNRGEIHLQNVANVPVPD